MEIDKVKHVFAPAACTVSPLDPTIIGSKEQRRPKTNILSLFYSFAGWLAQLQPWSRPVPPLPPATTTTITTTTITTTTTTAAATQLAPTSVRRRRPR
jgi:hypothetical protein